MSADNRLIIFEENSKWYVWHGSCSIDYFEPSAGASCFDTEEEAYKYAVEQVEEMSICEGGIQRLTNTEIVRGMREEIDRLRNPNYCPACGACGEEGCCSGAKCLYGDYYNNEYLYNREMADCLYEEFPDKDRLREIFERIWNKYFPISKKVVNNP